jgi:predicted nucleotide-binding protein
MLCGSAIAYGLTDGGYNAENIEITHLGKRITSPLREGDELQARREATLRPRIIREFLTKYDKAKFPREDIAKNVLAQLGAPREDVDRVLELIKESATSVGFLKAISGVSYVDLKGTQGRAPPSPLGHLGEGEEEETTEAEVDRTPVGDNDLTESPAKVLARSADPSISATQPKGENRRVFVTHGKNKALVPQLKELLTFGKFEPIVSIERESLSKPVPDKVMDDMRLCGAAIIHVDADRELMTSAGEREIVHNPNVLIEIGAAIALYGRKFILLVQNGVRLPSNLQGLYEVRYEGDKLDGDATLRLLKAFNEFNT